MKLIRVILTPLICFVCFPLLAQHQYECLTGNWIGGLHTKNGEMIRLVLAVEEEGDSIKIEIDSPDQYVFGIKIVSLFVIRDTVILKIPFTSANLEVVLNGRKDTLIGLYIEKGDSIPIIFSKSEKRPVLLRPQEPKPPFYYLMDEQVVIRDSKNGEPVIRGTLTWPDGKSPKATVIMISGSGWQDRNNTVFGHKPFWVIANYLTDLGYAVFRYDDLPHIIFTGSTTLDFAYYVKLIVDSLAKDDRCNHVPIGLLGHSEGGLIAFIAASENKNIDFVISMSGMGESFKEVLLYQIGEAVKQTDFTPQEIAKTIDNSRHIYTIMETSYTLDKAVKEVERYFDMITRQMTPKEKMRYGYTDRELFLKKSALSSPWFFAIFKMRPEKYLKKIKVPVYALHGSKDVQVNASTNILLIKKYLKSNSKNRFEIFPGLNHLLQESDKGTLDEYGVIEQTISPLVLEKIGEWLNSLYP